MAKKIRVYIGTGPGLEKACDTLIVSIYENASCDPKDIELHIMEAWGPEKEWRHWHGQPNLLDPDLRGRGFWVTPFTLFRYAIPHVCEFEGYAIYLDADMIMLGDIVHLWQYRTEGKWACAANAAGDCVSVVDCSAMKNDSHWPPFDKLRGGYADKHQMRRIAAPYMLPVIPETWNSHDLYEEGRTQLVHYTGIKTQPMKPWPDAVNYEAHPDPAAVALWEEWSKRAETWQMTSLA